MKQISEVKMISEYEQFVGIVRNASGQEVKTLMITIPAKLRDFMGLKADDTVKILIKKVPKEE